MTAARRSSAGALLALGGALLAVTAPALAQEPLSAIDWLKSPAPITVAQPLEQTIGDTDGDGRVESDEGLRSVAPARPGGVTVPDVAVMPLGEAQADAVGLLPASTTGLPPTLWEASATDALAEALAELGGTPLPAVQALYYTLILAEAEPPSDVASNARFLIARVDALRSFGAVEPALALIERAGPRRPELFDSWMDLALLTGEEHEPCRALMEAPRLTGHYATRIFCLARAGDWQTAALTLETAAATGALSPHEEALLTAFLDPEAETTAATMAPPRHMSPLVFRLYEAVGTFLPTRTLPREYAVADLRGTMGWRAEIEAAERLAQTGALPANRLLGLYTQQRPAASGGVWERVRAMQEIDAAMESGEPQAVALALPRAWLAMKAQGLGVAFATLYGERLAAMDLPSQRDVAHEVALLSPAYERAAEALGPQTARLRFLEGLARGAPDGSLAETQGARAIAQGFAAREPGRGAAELLARGALGEAILQAARALDGQSATPGRAVSEALATLRLVGLEDMARRAALQMLLLQGA
ncbi:MAG: hypothetical protein RIG84_02770 [Roseovarius sp.]